MFESVLRIIPLHPSWESLFGIIVGLIIIWIIISIPVYVAGKLVKGGKASLGSAMAATLLGPIVYIVVLFSVEYFLGGLLGSYAFILAFVLAFIAWLWVYKSVFQTGWIGAFGIALLSVIIFFILNLILAAIFGIVMLGMFFPSPLLMV